jgi:hypothetical protein
MHAAVCSGQLDSGSSSVRVPCPHFTGSSVAGGADHVPSGVVVSTHRPIGDRSTVDRGPFFFTCKSTNRG